MEFEKTWPLEMYSKMIDNKWVELPSTKGRDYLHIKGSQMMVVNGSVAVETICLLGGGGSIQAHYSNQNIGVSVVINKKANSKFKIRFTHSCGRSAEDNCLEVVNVLGKFIQVTQHPSHKERKPAERVTKTMTQVKKDILERNPELLKTSELILTENNIKELLQECFLDPGFPSLVAKVEDLLENHSSDDV